MPRGRKKILETNPEKKKKFLSSLLGGQSVAVASRVAGFSKATGKRYVRILNLNESGVKNCRPVNTRRLLVYGAVADGYATLPALVRALDGQLSRTAIHRYLLDGYAEGVLGRRDGDDNRTEYFVTS